MTADLPAAGDQQQQTDAPKGEPNLLWARVLAFLVVAAISVGIFLLPEEQIEALESWGYVGNFLIAVITNATVILPAPGILVVFSLGARLNPFWVAITAGLGATIGELSGYTAGFSGQAVIPDVAVYERLVGWMRTRGGIVIFILAAIPNPLFDFAGIAAGALKMPLTKFFLWVSLGKIAKMAIVAYSGAGILNIPGIS
jgi:uncharacterized membrane protein YdjX (TVP38/TMEM64 family)